MTLPISSRPFFWVAQVLGLTAIILVTLWTIRFRGGLSWRDKDHLFNHHPFFMLLGFVILNGEAIMSLRTYPWIGNEKTRTIIHLFSHALAFILGIYGLVAVFKSQKQSNIANFHSLHSWIGIGIFVLYGILFVYTSTVFSFPEVIRRRTDYQGRIHGLLRSTVPDANAPRIHGLLRPIGPDNNANEQEESQGLLRYTGPDNNAKERGRVYGLLRFVVPAGSRISEDPGDIPRIRGLMRFFNPRGGFSAKNNQKEQIAGDLRFHDPTGVIHKRNEQGRMYGISRFFHYGGRLEPENKEVLIDSIESMEGTLELTSEWIPWHSLFGMVVYIGVVGNAALGFLLKLTILENYAAAAKVVPKYGSEAYLVNSTAIITVLFGVFVIFTLLGDPVTIRIETSLNHSPQDPRSGANTPSDETNPDSNV